MVVNEKKRNIGLPPGTLIYTGVKSEEAIKITYVEYDENYHSQEVFENTNQLPLHKSDDSIVQWYDVRGLHDVNLIESIAQNFGVHTLVMEDIVDVYKRPSYTEYTNGHFISLKAFEFNEHEQSVKPQAISIYFGKGFVLSFQEHDDDFFMNLRSRIAHSQGRIRKKGADYLAYAIVDHIVDKYYTVNDQLEELLEHIEQRLNDNVDSIDKGQLHSIKVNLVKLRRSVAPLREALNQFIRTESELVDDSTEVYLRDVYDHTIQITESIDTLRDVLSGLHDLYLSEISMKMNRIMQFLTIVTAIFVPLSFLTGVYGMNFEVIPELKHPYGYFILWGVMIFIAILMLWWFRRKKWL